MAEAAATPNSDAPPAQSTTEPAAPTTAAQTATPAAPAAAAPDKETAAADRRDYTQRLATLTQKERALQQRMEKAKADLLVEREAFERQRQEVAEAVEWRRQLEEVRRQDPLKALELATGMNYEQLTQYILNNGQPDPVSAVKSEFDAWKKEQQAQQKAAQEAQQKAIAAQQARQYQQWASTVVNYVKQNPADYELIHTYDQFHLVPQVIETHYKQTEQAGLPVLLTEKEAADKVEAWLLDQAEKATKTRKLQAKLKPAEPATPATPASEPAAQQQAPAAPAQPRTLSELPAASPTMPFVPRQNDDRIARAAAAMDRVRSARSTS